MRSRRVLFVDDDLAVRLTLARCLRGFAVDADIVDGPEAALESARTEEYALIVSDLRMPGGNGADLLRALRPVQPKATLVLVSGCHREVDADEFDVFLQKPWSVTELRRVIDEAIASWPKAA